MSTYVVKGADRRRIIPGTWPFWKSQGYFRDDDADGQPDALGGPFIWFDRHSPDGNQEIYRSRPDGSSPVRLTFDTAYQSWWAKVSPDGHRVLFLRVPAAQTNYDGSLDNTSLWTMNIDGTGLTQIVAQGTYTMIGTPHWHPGGRRILFFGGTGANLIRTINDDGSDYQTVTVTGIASGVGDVAYSPDGNAIAFCWQSNIYAVSAAGGNAIPLTTDGATTPNFDPAFSPDGSRVAMLTRTAAPDGGHFLGQWGIRIVAQNGLGALTTVLNDGNVNSRPNWANDGRLYFHRYVYGDPGFSLASIYPDGTGIKRLSSGSVRDGYPNPGAVVAPLSSARVLVKPTTTYYVAVTDSIILTEETADIAVALPDPAQAVIGKPYSVLNTKAFNVVVASLGTSKTINGAANKTLTQWQGATFVTDGVQWFIVP